ncbi:MAG TPA: GGDEF domain-containing protein [Acidimicrobiales bacterium]|nr:GGDEF domain-containing protein [Acidimicrobiales bacterium]
MSAGMLEALDGSGSPPSEERERSPLARSLGAHLQTLLQDPSQAAAIFWGGGALAALSVLPICPWPRDSLLALVSVAGFCTISFALRTIAGNRLPVWTLHVDVGLATVIIGVMAVAGVSNNVDFADIYVWVALFAALYFRPIGVLAHLAGIGVAYFLVVALGPTVPSPGAAWLSIVGTDSVAALVMVGVVGLLRSSADLDPLTGIANRRGWDKHLEVELERSRRTGQALSVAMIDIDGFKAVNDRDGHQAGDRVLQELANNWTVATRGGGDFLARLGGDEFGLLAPGSDATGIRSLARRLIDVLPQGVAVSVGVATWDGSEGASQLVRCADQSMYRSKSRHRRGDMRLYG